MAAVDHVAAGVAGRPAVPAGPARRGEDPRPVTVLRWSDDVVAVARRVLAAERARLAAAGVPGELVLVGAASVPGALTRGDVDLHLRVPPDRFATTVAALRSLHPVVHPEIWAPTLATFAVPAEISAGLAATPLDSEHDRRFTRTWAVLAADPQLLAEHNAVKHAASSQGDAEYERAKSAFFDRVVAGWDAHPASRPAAPPPG